MRRCVQIATGLRGRGIESLFYLPNEPNSITFIKNAGVPYQLATPEYGIEQLLSSLNNTRVVVLDLLHADKEYTGRIRKTLAAIKILGLDYFDMHDDQIDVIINLYNHSPDAEKPFNSNVKYKEGPEWGIIRNDFLKYTGLEKSYDEPVKKVLVTFGGADPRKHTLAVITVLAELVLEITIIIGPNFHHEEDIRKLVKQIIPLAKIYKNPADLALLMFESGVCICGSGTTILESAAMGTPTIIIPQSTEELGFASVFENAGFAMIAGTPTNIDNGKIRDFFFQLNSQTGMARKIGMTGRGLCDGKGAEKIIREITYLLESE